MKKTTLFFAMLFVTLMGYGQTAMSGTYKVGTGEVSPDFTSLKTAIDAINVNGVGGNIVLEITSDLTEAANIGLGVDTKGYSITIRPAGTDLRTVTFTQLADNTSPTGHFVIGYPSSGLTVAWSDANTIATNNVTIDGFPSGGTQSKLKFTNTSASHTGARVIVVIGACENTVIKNCIIDNLTTSTSSPFCVGAVVRKGTDIEVAPKTLVIENNTMTALGNNVAMGMRTTNSGTLTSGAPVKIKGLVIKNNKITAKRRLIELNYIDGADISNNTFTSEATGAAGTISYGLWTSTGVVGTVNIFNNKFVKAVTEETGAYGHRVVSLSSGATYKIYNNMFAGLDKTKASTVGLNLAYLFYSGVSGTIYNNTFYMPALTDPSSAGYYNAIQISGNTAEVKNNIFISNEPTHANTAFISAVPNPESDNNVFYLSAPHTGAKTVSNYVTLADYQTANPTKDISSKSVDVNFTNAAVGDLTLTGTSIGDYQLAAPVATGITTDILGTTRNTPLVYKGAHEAGNINAVAKQFTVTAPQGTEKVYIAGSFTGKDWDITTPFELTKTAIPYEFTGIFPCADGVEYKYLSGVGNWDYQEAASLGSTPWTTTNPVKPSEHANRTYNAADVVANWVAQPQVKLNVSFDAGYTGAIPTQLFVKGGWDNWATGIAMTSSTTPLAVPGAQFVSEATNAVSFTGLIGNGTTDLIYSNTEYKYYTNEPSADNWENRTDNRWTIYPLMNDVIASFIVNVATGFDQPEMRVDVLRTPTGIEVRFNGEAAVELYNMNGALLDKTRVSERYYHDLESGAYIIRVNGVSTKFVR